MREKMFTQYGIIVHEIQKIVHLLHDKKTSYDFQKQKGNRKNKIKHEWKKWKKNQKQKQKANRKNKSN